MGQDVGMTWYDARMRTTVYLPDELAEEVKAYLKAYPGKSLSTLVREALEAHLRKNPSRLLELAGLVEKAPVPAKDRAEDQVPHGR